jgi:hypothetical protein
VTAAPIYAKVDGIGLAAAASRPKQQSPVAGLDVAVTRKRN